MYIYQLSIKSDSHSLDMSPSTSKPMAFILGP